MEPVVLVMLPTILSDIGSMAATQLPIGVNSITLTTNPLELLPTKFFG